MSTTPKIPTPKQKRPNRIFQGAKTWDGKEGFVWDQEGTQMGY